MAGTLRSITLLFRRTSCFTIPFYASLCSSRVSSSSAWFSIFLLASSRVNGNLGADLFSVQIYSTMISVFDWVVLVISFYGLEITPRISTMDSFDMWVLYLIMPRLIFSLSKRPHWMVERFSLNTRKPTFAPYSLMLWTRPLIITYWPTILSTIEPICVSFLENLSSGSP